MQSQQGEQERQPEKVVAAQDNRRHPYGQTDDGYQ